MFENISIKYFSTDTASIPNVTHVIENKLLGTLLYMQKSTNKF